MCICSSWQLSADTRHKVKSEFDGTQQLDIKNVTSADQGKYECVAKTTGSDTVTTATTIVIKGNIV